MDRRMAQDLDRHITGNWGEDQLRDGEEGQQGLPCSICGQPLDDHDDIACQEEYEA